ncbi:MAG: MBL fold metallo-hydrolase, partial [Ardenticatenaceae bacterium]
MPLLKSIQTPILKHRFILMILLMTYLVVGCQSSAAQTPTPTATEAPVETTEPTQEIGEIRATLAPVTPAPIDLPQEGIGIEWLGHGSFKLVSREGLVILIDPWIFHNPSAPAKYRSLEEFGKVDLILYTHGHLDHFSPDELRDLVDLFNPQVIAPLELSLHLKEIIPKADALIFGLANKGGSTEIEGIKISMVRADHSSSTPLIGG